MRSVSRALPVLSVLLVCAVPGAAQSTGGGSGVMDALLADVEVVEGKLLGLAEAIPAERYDWRPAEGVRSVAEVLWHVAADNYVLTAMGGTPAPEWTGIEADSYASVRAFENEPRSRAETMDVLRDSFAFMKDAMRSVGEGSLGDTVRLFSRETTVLELWVMATTHLHEHLGQSIAYARSNGVVPPWSRSGGD